MAMKPSRTAAAGTKRKSIPIGVTQLPSLPSKARLEMLSDGIFAVAMTLLVLDLRLPVVPPGADSGQLVSALLHIWPKFIAFILSFLFLARAWNAHRAIYHYIEHVDYAFSYLNIIWLLFVCLLPFSTSLIAEHPKTSIAAAIYATNLLLLPGIMYVMWHYAIAKNLLNKKSGAGVGNWALRRFRTVIATTSLAIPVAFINSELAILWILCLHVVFDARPFFTTPKETHGV